MLARDIIVLPHPVAESRMLSKELPPLVSRLLGSAAASLHVYYVYLTVKHTDSSHTASL